MLKGLCTFHRGHSGTVGRQLFSQLTLCEHFLLIIPGNTCLLCERAKQKVTVSLRNNYFSCLNNTMLPLLAGWCPSGPGLVAFTPALAHPPSFSAHQTLHICSIPAAALAWWIEWGLLSRAELESRDMSSRRGQGNCLERELSRSEGVWHFLILVVNIIVLTAELLVNGAR